MSRLMHLPVTATTTLMATTMNLLTNAFERLGRFDNDEGTTTIEYAMAALAAAALAGVRIVGGIGHSLGKQRDRAGRSFQLMGHVGNKVAPNRLEPTLFGHVIDKDGVQVIANIANAHAQIQHVGWHRLPRFKPPAV